MRHKERCVPQCRFAPSVPRAPNVNSPDPGPPPVRLGNLPLRFATPVAAVRDENHACLHRSSHRQTARRPHVLGDRPEDCRAHHGRRRSDRSSDQAGGESRLDERCDASNGRAPWTVRASGGAGEVCLLPRGKRLEAARAVAKTGASLDERIEASDRSGVGGKIRRLDDRRISSTFFEGSAPYRCPCLPEAAEPLPATYCQCCGGRIKHHMQIALGRKLSVEVKSSILSSGGKKPCEFHLTIEE